VTVGKNQLEAARKKSRACENQLHVWVLVWRVIYDPERMVGFSRLLSRVLLSSPAQVELFYCTLLSLPGGSSRFSAVWQRNELTTVESALGICLLPS
jgi:hypothetical protein